MLKTVRPVPPDTYSPVDLQVMRLLAEPAKMQAEKYIAGRLDAHRRQVRFERDIIDLIKHPAPVLDPVAPDTVELPSSRRARLGALVGTAAAIVALALLWLL